jgi:ABC-type dipeptide/oligopeptide/nickel transport system ATPase component
MPIDEEERILKIAKAIITLINLLEDNTKLALLIIKHDLEIPIPRTYDKAVNNPNYS